MSAETDHSLGPVTITARGLTAAAAATAMSTAVQAARSLVIGKTVALILGTQGVGVLAQLSSLQSVVLTLSYAGLSSPLTKMLARAPERASTTFGAAAAISLTSALVVAVVIALGLEPISRSLGLVGIESALIVLVCTAPASSLAALYEYFLQAFGRVHRIALARVLSASASAIVTVALVAQLGIYGLALGLGLSAVSDLIARRILLIGVRPGVAIARPRIDVALPLVASGLLILLTGAAQSVSALALRSLIVAELSLDAAGLYQAVFLISNFVWTVFVTLLSLYVFPRLSRAPSSDVGRLLEQTLMGSILLFPLPLFLLQFIAPLALVTLFTDSFLGVTSLLQLQIAGDFVRMIAWSFGSALYPRGMYGLHALLLITQAVVVPVGAALLMPITGLTGVVVAGIVSWLALGFGAFVALRLKADIRVTPRLVPVTVAILVSLLLPVVGVNPELGALTQVAAWSVLVVAAKPGRLFSRRGTL